MSIKLSKVQERGIQTSVQSAKYKVQHRFIYPVNKVHYSPIKTVFLTGARVLEAFKARTYCIIRYGCPISSLSPLWAVSGRLPCLVSAKNLKGCLPFLRSEQFLLLVQFLFERSVQAVDPASAASHACCQQPYDESLQFLLQRRLK